MADAACYRSFLNRDRLVHILDPDPAACEALSGPFRAEGFRTAVSVDARSFNAAFARRRPDAAIVNMQLGDQEGLAILRRVRSQRAPTLVFMLVEKPQISSAVAAMKAGAADVLTTPVDAGYLLGAVRHALAHVVRPDPAPRAAQLLDLLDFAQLTPREGEVLQLISSGRSNKEAGLQLGISSRTIEVHRARVMEKLGARNTADLMRIVLAG